jgi:hypothetical protein
MKMNFIGWKSSFIKILCLTTLLVYSFSAFGRTPMPKKCSPKTRRKMIRKVKKIFPNIKKTSFCRFFGSKQMLSFHSFTKKVNSKFEFYIESPTSIFIEKKPRGFSTPAKTINKILIVPFENKKDIKKVAKKLMKLSLVKALGKKKIYCHVSTDAPGSTAYYYCTTFKSKSSTLNKSKPGVKYYQSLANPAYNKKKGKFKLYEYVIPLKSMNKKVKRWKKALQNKKVKDFIAKNKDSMVVLKNWHQDYLTIIPKNKKSKKLIVVFGKNYGRKPTKSIINVCEGVSYYKCIMDGNKKINQR